MASMEYQEPQELDIPPAEPPMVGIRRLLSLMTCLRYCYSLYRYAKCCGTVGKVCVDRTVGLSATVHTGILTGSSKQPSVSMNVSGHLATGFIHMSHG